MKNHNSRIQLFGAIVAATTLSLTCGFAAPNPERDAYFGAFLHHYNWHRTHSAPDHHPPISRLNLTLNNLLSLHS